MADAYPGIGAANTSAQPVPCPHPVVGELLLARIQQTEGEAVLAVGVVRGG